MNDNNKEKGILREEFSNYRTDFMILIQILFRRKFLIILGTLAITVGALIFSLIRPSTYKSEAFFQLSGSDLMAVPGSRTDLITVPGSRTDLMTVPEYKRITSIMTHPENFFIYMQGKKIFSPEEIARLRNELVTSQDIEMWISPVFSLSSEDVQKLAKLNEEEKSFVMGVKLEYINSSPEKAIVFVKILGQFIRECILNIQLKDYVENRFNFAATNTSYYENMVIEQRFQLEELIKKRKEIQSVYTKYPESSKIETRQVVSIEQEGYRYLAPIAQLVGIESSIADIKEQIAAFEREKEKAEILFEFFSAMKEFMGKNDSGEAIFNRLSTLRDEMFMTMDMNLDTVKEVYNKLTIDYNNFKTRFYETMRFIEEPSWFLVETPKKTIIILAFFAGLFVFVFLAFVIDFWEKNKSLILKK